MKNGELKNRLRRRTADKLYDLDRTNGNVPAHQPAVETPEAPREVARRTGRPTAKRQPGRSPAAAS